ncbi:MazG nucleotide pyrophosphohydrolase domain-containing protein [Haladaptatus cibarius]|uniref:MazG nucleotide pyrophosphohydrolase domain-containing protein n=1 Tax=Haladaptatus cibarius TaxID=453847 RepID=UPI0006787B25|nr:MazG-like family protein [Haladaptatus cibarius]
MTEVGELNEELDLHLDPELRMLDLVSETGELSKTVLVTQEYGESEFELTDEMVDEFGDVYYCLLSFAHEVGIDPDEALETSLEKYRARLGESGSVGSGE